jgi:chromosome segregation protein
MYLKRLELQGFKSFADKTVLELMPGLTTVIGPNGSGKSNISDAIRWVLGEQSMKSLRGTKSEDIIFAGTQNRKSLGFAEASLVFDNSDEKLPIEYSEVTVTRKIYRSGESGYYINKTPCRLKDILELFMDTGIGKDGYSIIGQGKIDDILSNKSEDRRHIFEEAAGIVKYRARKEESEKKLEHTKLNLLRVDDIVTEIEGSIGPLKEQSEKAKKYLDYRENLKNIEVGLFLHNIEENKNNLSKIEEDEKILKENYEDELTKQNKFQIQKDDLKSDIDNITNQIEEMQKLGFESTNKIEKINSDIKVNEERISNNEINYKRFEEDINETKNKIEELKEEQKTKENKKENLYKNKEKFETELKEKQEELEKISSKLSEKEIEIEEKKKKVEANIDLKYENQNVISTQNATFEEVEKREKTLKNEVQTTISELDSSRITKGEIEKEFSEIESKRNKAQEKLNNINEKRAESTQKIKEYEDEINKISYNIRMKDSRLKFLQETEKEKEGYTKSVKNLLLDCDKNKELSKGVCGVLANIVSTEKEYETAIEMCLGGSLQNIVTETESEAKKLVEHLRKNNMGRASFLPITSVKGRKIDKYDSKHINGIIGVASDLVKYDKKYEGIILSLLGRTIIVDNMDNGVELAKKNRYSFRIVTLKGDVINPSGSITGGSVMQKTVNILGRSREIESIQKEINVLNKKLENIQKEKEDYLSDIEDVLEEASSLEQNMQEIDITYATEKQKMVSIEENVERLENRLARLKQERESIINKKQELNAIKEEAKEQIEKLSKENEELNKVIEEFANLNKDNQKYIDDLNFDITNLKISVSSFEESEMSIKEMTERIEEDIKNNEESIRNKQEQLSNIKNDNEQLMNNINELKNKITQIKEDVENSGNKVEKLKEERIKSNEKLEKTEKEIESLFKTIEGLKEQLVKIDVKKTKTAQDIEDIINKMWEEYELTPNSCENYEKPANVAQTQKRVKEIREEIKKLGSINVDSIEEYKQLKERYDFMCEQRLDLEDAIAKLKKIINEMTQVMKEQFSEKFKIINKNFNEVFKELFGGGKAELILTDEQNILECGIEIQAQPTGKKLQNMSLLSGGERALTAIALLFAILKINPSPFCVLDEIEAALDDVNVFRYADYLKKFTKETQFLVITHRKGTMEAADTVYGVTMEENGISKLLSMKLK